jgi:RNA polymerase sigma-70 factor (ECF subfamily)
MTHLPPAHADVHPSKRTHDAAELSPREWIQLHSDISAFIRRRIRDAADAEDVVQACVVRLYQSLLSLRSREQLRAWAYRSARHAVIDHYRTRARHCQEVFDEERMDVPAMPSDTSAAATLASCIPPSLLRLSVADRDTLARVDFGAQSQVAAAVALGVSVSGMKSRVQRARRRLKAVIEECCTVTLDRRGGIADIAPRAGACSCQPACGCAS